MPLDIKEEEDQPSSPSRIAIPSEVACDPAQADDTVPKDGDEADGTPAVAPKASLCGVCHVNAPKYKCPRCYLP